MGLGIILLIMLLTSSILCASSAAKLYAIDDIHSDPCKDSEYKYKPSPELPLGRWNFPEGFVFGTATSSYQEDVKRMLYMNVDAYRFSISWPRVIPSGRRSDGISEQGIAFYHRLLDVLIENKIDPYVTIWHWDTPQLLEAEYGGFLSRNIVKDYVDYCDLLFEEYGSKVKKWITLNEPMGTTGKAYDEGVFAPGHCSPWVDRKCRLGDSGTEPYIVAHNLLLAHSAAYHLYKSKYQNLTAEIGVTYVTHWFVPYSNATKDVDAAQRALDWMYGWFMDPITFGDKDGVPIGPALGSYWQYLYPDGLRVLLEYTKKTYVDPVIYITENGLSEKDNATQTLAEALRDESRIDFYNRHLTSVLTAMKEKQVNVKGYFAWSYADNFEWNEGYTVRFGLNYVNYTDLSRHPKYSACWFTNFCSRTKPKSFDLYNLFTTTSTDAALGGRRALYSSAGRFN
ncbi:Beta-glucosidase 11 [Linum perenne]